MNSNKSVSQSLPLWTTMREHISPLFICSILAFLATLFLGIVIGLSNIVYGLAVAGALLMVILVLFRWDELTVAFIIAVHLWIDWYLALHLVAILMSLLLLFIYYFGESIDHPWVRPHPLWLWILFLVLTIYPSINGGQYLLYDAASYYPSVVLGAFLMFWLGNIIAKDIFALRRVFQLLSFIGAFVAIHTIIEATTGKFLFESAHAEVFFTQVARNLNITGTYVTRSGSFLFDPNWNGCFLAMMFFLPLGLCIESKSLPGKLFFFAEMMLIVVALLLTYSNGAWIALLGGGVAFAFWIGHRVYRWGWIILILLIAFLILTLLHAQVSLQLQRASSPEEFSMRLGAWETGIRVMEAYPVFGVGLGNQAYLIQANPFIVPDQVMPLGHPHNAYIQWGAMAGIPVMIIFLLLLAYSFWQSWRNWQGIDPRYRPLLGGGITALIALSINSISIDGWTNAVMATFGWLLFGMLASPLLRTYVQDAKGVEGAVT